MTEEYDLTRHICKEGQLELYGVTLTANCMYADPEEDSEAGVVSPQEGNSGLEGIVQDEEVRELEF